MATHAIPKLSEEEYLRVERAAEFKSEFVAGEVFAMSGGSPNHSELTANFITALRPKLQGVAASTRRTCEFALNRPAPTFIPIFQLYAVNPNCTPIQDDILINPWLIVEVLSPASEKYDRGKKFDLYREIPSVGEYVLCHQDCVRLEIFTRRPDESWIYGDIAGLASTVKFASVGCEISLGDIYSGIDSDRSQRISWGQ